MSSRTSKKSEIKRSPKWSDWAWDASQSQWYRTRQDADGNYEYDTRAAATASDETPRDKSSASGLSPLLSTASEGTYYQTDNYGYQGSQLSANSVDVSNTSSYQGDTSDRAYSLPMSSVSTYAGAQPIPINSSSTSSSGYDYSASAPSGGYDSGSSASYYGNSRGQQYPLSYNVGDTSLSSSYASTSTITPAHNPYATNTSNTKYGGKDTGSVAVTLDEKTIHKNIPGTEGYEEKLDPRFRIHNSKYFKPGHVFKVLWSEPQGQTASNATDVTDCVFETKFGERAHSTIRRFVIVAADHGHCQCLPILTYRHQGTLKQGVKGYDHTIIYTGNYAPLARHGETLEWEPIKVIPKTPRDKLDPDSRLNYAKIYTVEHNVKVWFIGEIAAESQRRLITDFDATWAAKRQITGSWQA